MHDDNSPGALKGPCIIGYNLREEERPGGPDGIKVRWKWRVVTGRKAETIDARQAEAIRKALIMATPPHPRARDRRPGRTGPGRDPGPHLHPRAAGPVRVAEPADHLRPGMAARGLLRGRVLLGRGVRRPGHRAARPRQLRAAHRPGPAPGRGPGRPADRSPVTAAPVRRRGGRGHRAVRPGHLQFPETGTATGRPGYPAVRHRRARRHHRDQPDHHSGPADQARRRGMVPAATERKNLERAERAHRAKAGTSAPSPTGTSPSGYRTPTRSRPPRAAPKPA